MTIGDVSNETLLEDVRNTELEFKAYGELEEGFFILSKLPENEGYQSSDYLMKSQHYGRFKRECFEFLEKLLKLEQERGLL